MEPQVSIDVQVNFIPSQTVLLREVYTSPPAEEEEVVEYITPNLTGIDFGSVLPLAFVIPL